MHGGGHDDPGARLTRLPLVHQAAEQRAVRGQLQVGVVEDDVRALAAELQRQPFDVARGHPHDLAPDGRRAGEGDLPHVRVAGQPGSDDRPSPGTTFRTPGGSPHSCAILANSSSVSGVRSSGLITRVLPAASAGPIFHMASSSGKFHGHDGRAHADRLTPDEAAGQRGHLQQRAGPLEGVGADQVGEVAQVGDGKADLEGPGLADRRAVLQRLEDGQVVDSLGELVRYRVQHGGPLRRRRPAPPAPLMRGPGRRDRPVGVLAVALGHAGYQLLGGRAADLQPVAGVDPVSVDEHGVAPDGVHPGLLSRCDPRR